jgi:FkbM family methyltransferase
VSRAAEEIACRARIYRPARNAYHRYLRRSGFRARERWRGFFAQFVSPGDLVFDLGAHQGRYSEVYLELGASVVAVEPLPHLARLIGLRYRAVTVVDAAVGAEPGTADLHVGVYTVHSSIAPRWIETELRRNPKKWTSETIAVRLTTLDTLIGQYGLPAFTKIDVEGYEPEVLAGLSTALPLLSFEAQALRPDLALRCLDRLGELGSYEFNFSPGLEMRLAYERWVTADQLREDLPRLAEKWNAGAGDVYARSV